MATSPAAPFATPRYALGTQAFHAYTDITTEKLPCPDCLGTGQWTATSPAGQEFTLGCPRCGQYTYHDLPRLGIRRFTPRVQALTINGYEVRHDGAIEYKATKSNGGGWYVLTEDKIVTDREKAEAEADALARLANAKEDERPEVIQARHFASMRLDDAQFDSHKNGVWTAHYHAGQLVQRVRSALYGDDTPDDEEMRDQAAVLEDLRDAARWDFQYHIDALPLSGLIRAAAETADPAVAEALAKMPEPLVNLFMRSLKPEESAGMVF